jgi:3-vinyl bacteriochlorophyllide hydratase
MVARRAASFVSVGLLVGYFNGAVSFDTVHESVLVKVALMIGAIVTGALWEKDVFGHYWFAPEFLGEDTMTVNVLILHISYLAMVIAHPENLTAQIGTLLVAYTVYIGNVAQYILRTANLGKHVAVRVRSQ